MGSITPPMQQLHSIGSDKGMIHLDKLRQAYMLAALNTKEAYSKQIKERHDEIPQYKIGDLVMVKNSTTLDYHD